VLTNPGNKHSLEEANNLQRDLQTDWYQVVIQNHKRQKVEHKVTCLQVYKQTNINTVKTQPADAGNNITTLAYVTHVRQMLLTTSQIRALKRTFCLLTDPHCHYCTGYAAAHCWLNSSQCQTRFTASRLSFTNRTST